MNPMYGDLESLNLEAGALLLGAPQRSSATIAAQLLVDEFTRQQDSGLLSDEEVRATGLAARIDQIREYLRRAELPPDPENAPMEAVCRATIEAQLRGWPRTLAVMETTDGKVTLIEVGGAPSPAMRGALAKHVQFRRSPPHHNGGPGPR